MRDANLVRVLQRQTQARVGLIPLDRVEAGPAAVMAAFAEALRAGLRLVIVDAIHDRHLRIIGEACADMKLITGGSGIAMGLPDNFRKAGTFLGGAPPARLKAPAGKPVMLAGSCSAATRGQVRTAIEAGTPALQLDALAIAEGQTTPESVVAWIEARSGERPALVYSSADPEIVRAVQEKLGRDAAGALVEALMAKVGRRLFDRGFGRFVIAGGETSGAVVEALGAKMLQIGPEIAPGVPWTRSIDGPDLALALKSGNFGGPDFFLNAWTFLDG
jgi:uncharacterized protein YgbK (DUF1537 family)